MNPHKHIENLNSIISALKSEINYSKNKVFSANRVNALIDISEGFDSLLTEKYKVDAIDKLICHIFKDQLLRLSAENPKSEIPLKSMIDKIDFTLGCSRELCVNSLAKDIRSHLIGYTALKLDYNLSEGVTSDKKDIDDISKEIMAIDSLDHYERLINKLLISIKRHISWKK